jgi:hypothetical protein
MPDLINPVTGNPMKSMSEVFGNERESPHAVFQKSRIENVNSAPRHRENDLALACPSCRAEGNPNVRLMAKNDVGYYCLAGKHKWNDMDQLMSLNPDKLKFLGTAARQEGWEKFTMEMPGSVLQDLNAKFGDRLGATLRGFIEILATQKFILVPEENLKKIVDLTGQEIPNAITLQGVVYNMKVTLDQQKQELEQFRQNPSAQGQASPSSVTVELGMMYQMVKDKAESLQMPISEVVRYCLELCIKENGWV